MRNLRGRSEELLFGDEWNEAVKVLENAFGGRQVSWTSRSKWWMLICD